MEQKKILFLGETYRADAITWIEGLKKYGNFEIITWELKTPSTTLFNRFLRFKEYLTAISYIKKIIRTEKPDMVIAERTTSYGFLAANSGAKNIAVAQQGITDIFPENAPLNFLKVFLKKYALKKATLIHAWGEVMVPSIIKYCEDTNKIMVLPKGIKLNDFGFKYIEDKKIKAIVTRSLLKEYCHETILKAFGILHQKNVDFELTIVGDGLLLNDLKALTKTLNISEKVIFTGRIPNHTLPKYLQEANYYISMPNTEGVSASLFEAMACGCYPLVTDIAGNQAWIKNNFNGNLIPINNYTILAENILKISERENLYKEAVYHNRNFVEKNANFDINMKLIADKYNFLINLKK